MRANDLTARLRLAEQHVLTVFIDPRTVAAILQVPVDEVEETCDRARAGDLELQDLGLTDDDVLGVLEARGGGPPEIEAVRVAFALIGTRRETILESIQAPATSMRR